jgi:PAS domain S-box-containing protein
LLRRNQITSLLVLWVSISLSQLQVRNYFSLTGKKDVPVNAITQDKTGFLWLGTSDGLYKFDGRSAVAIEADGILKKEITALYIDHFETVWIGTRQGKIYMLTGNKVDSLKLPRITDRKKITAFHETSSGMCAGTYGNGIYAWSGSALSHFTSDKGLSDNVIYNIAGNGDTIWCGTDGGISEIKDVFQKPVFRVLSTRNGLPDNIVRDVRFGSGKLLIAMQDSGVCYYNLAKKEFERRTFFYDWTLGAIVNARDQGLPRLVVATEKNGLLQLDKGSFSIYKYEDYQIPHVNQLFVDMSGQYWLASKRGITRLGEKRYSYIDASKGLDENTVLALATDRDKSIWIGTTKVISRIRANDQGKQVVTKVAELDKYTISCASRAPDGKIWFGTYGNGIIVLNSESTLGVKLNAVDHLLPNDNISHIFFGDSGTVYISTLGAGLIKGKVILDGMSSQIKAEKIFTESDGLGSNYVYMAITGNKGGLYVATDGGGLQMAENGGFISLTKKFGFVSNSVISLCADKYNNIWAASNADGVLKYDGKKLVSITRQNGLRDEQPQQLISVGNCIFAINDKGIDKVNCLSNAVSYYDVFDGDLEPNLNAVCISGNKILSGTNNGVLIYRASQETLDSLKPSVFINSLQVNYKRIPLDSISEFNYNQNNLALGFDGIWLINPEKLSFRYKLQGLEEDWSYSKDGKVVNYNNLNPGKYSFIVQSRNEEDVWSDPTRFDFSILTPLWKRWWFWLLVITFSAAVIYFFVTYRLKSLQRENLLLDLRVKERTRQIEEQSQIIENKNRVLEQLSLVASKTDNVVVILDSMGRVEYINESFEKLNKMSVEELKKNYGETIYELSNNEHIREIISDAVSNKRSVNYESLNRKVEAGAEIWESSTLTPIFDDSGSLKKIIIIDTDVTVRKKQEQVIVQKNKDITDSISYAQKIQYAILPAKALIHSHLPHSFLLYMTKDIVSGDFYWFAHLKGFSIIAAVDCTGHGVPGAFMSLIGYNVLNRVVNERKITDPSEILLELNNGVLDVLHKNESESKDGMDIAICKIDHKNHTLEYAGAMRPLWIINNGELTEVKADKIPIGTNQKDREQPIKYTTHLIRVRKNDVFYIFTDGYSDQFGGQKDKKYSTSRFKQLLISNSTYDFKEQEGNIRNEHLAWRGDHEQVDDILVIGFSV